MNLEFTNVFEDIRGKIMVIRYGDIECRIVEIKKGFSRGGHYHPYPSEHYIISGKIEYREEDINSQNESFRIIGVADVIKTSSNMAHLFTALDDSLFMELSVGNYEAVYYPKYRKIVEEKMQTEK
jgi:hypothetical protein